MSSLNVTEGALAGGTSLSIIGTGFLSGATVTFGGSNGTSVTVVNSTTLSVTTPANAAGAVDVVVTNTDNQSAILTNGYTYRAAPTITSLNVTAGALGGATHISITGTGFLSGATVTFGGSSGTSVSLISSTILSVTTPAHAAGAVDVVVTNTDGQSGSLTSGYTYQAAPALSSLNTNAGALGGGTNLTITGTGFITGAIVSFGGTPGTSPSVVNATTITVTTPAQSAGAANIVVTNPDGQTGTLINGFTYQAAPTVSSLDISSGTTGGGTPITLTGTGFLTGATVKFGTTNGTSVSVINSTTITVTTPAHSAATVDVTVTNSDGQYGSLTSSFTYTTSSAPTISMLSVSTGGTVGGTAVTITGTGFQTGATVQFGVGSFATSVIVVNTTTISCSTPAHSSAATVDVIVTNTDNQSATLTSSFNYTWSTAPTVSSINVSYGPVWGGTPVTVTGTNFASGATVAFGGTTGAGTSVVNSTTITVNTPAGTYTGASINVVVTNPDGQFATLNSAFTYSPQNIFVTSTAYTGDMGGLYGADFRCQMAAHNAGLTGTWRAILSNSTVDASSRITYSGPPVLNRNNQNVPNVTHGLWNSATFAFAAAVGYDEYGVAVNDSVWTGTTNSGFSSNYSCSGWGNGYSNKSADAGSSTATTAVFSAGGNLSCNQTHRIFCIDSQSSGPAPSEATSFTNTAVGTDQATFNFPYVATNIAAFKMAYTTGSTAPSDCQSGTQISAYTIGTSTHYTVTGLSPGTQYSFRLCSTNSDLTSISSGLTATITTPTVDQYVFVTSSTTKGGFGSIYVGDLICQTEALDAGLPGIWKAILSSSTAAAVSRLNLAQPLYDTQSTPTLISRDSTDFWSTTHSTGIQYDTDGSLVGTVNAWTGTTSGGASSGADCISWTWNALVSADVGSSSATSFSLINSSASSCSTANHLYCTNRQSSSATPPDPATFVNTASGTSQATFTFTSGGGTTAGFRLAYTTGGTAPASCTSGAQVSAFTIGVARKWTVNGLSPGTQYSFRLCATNSDETAFSTGLTTTFTTPTTDMYVFITTGTHNGNFGGLSGANAFCQSEATTAGLSGTWVALLSTTSNVSSLVTIDQPVYNMANQLMANDSSEFWQGSYLATIQYTSTGANVGAVSAWTGSDASGATTTNHCNSWTLSGKSTATIGTSNQTNGLLIDTTTDKCNGSFHLYCISQ